MFSGIIHLYRLCRAGLTLSRSELITPAVTAELPALLNLAVKIARIGAGNANQGRSLSASLQKLGPSHIKLGQFLATRPDIIGQKIADQLSELQDRLAPFPQKTALRALEDGLGHPADKLFEEFGEPIAAASIAQVHKALITGADGTSLPVAVKILRPGIEARLTKDLESFRFAARLIETLSKPARRLRPQAAVEMLAQSVKIELDLRLEGAALSEMAHNTRGDMDFSVPSVDWPRTARRVLTSSWVDGISIHDTDALKAAGYDLPGLAASVIQSFLRHAMRDGFFHADMHPGNLFIDQQGHIVAVDLGIMGRLEPKDRLFLAEILYGFITRNYKRVAEVHFEAGYVPHNQSPELFAQALRAIGEPIMDKAADDISMAKLLAQLFQVTEQFDMVTQPQLLLLQKTMVVVEGVGRTLDPNLNMWKISEPVVRDWMTTRLGPEGRLQDAADGALALGRLVTTLPDTLAKFERVTESLETWPNGPTSNDSNMSQWSKYQAIPVWLGAAALCAIALALLT